jgi:hypothetical protein
MDRRSTLKWILSASTAMPLLARARADGTPPMPAPTAEVHGYGTDPDLTRTYRPGDLWPLTFDAQQRKTATALCDVVIPEDSVSRSASQAGVVEFLDEWISAPYPNHQKDRTLILEGLVWMDAEATRRFSKEYSSLSGPEQHAICDAICSLERAAPEFQQAARFFARYRDLTAGGFYTSPEGRQDLGYIGNVPLTRFEGPSTELLAQLGLL